ncbi:MAG TPA: GMC family oxidoreductase [Candidatus Dormibacteraeota bacterium]
MTRAADVVVVGAGWAGSIVAVELARAGLEVALLERGPRRDPGAGPGFRDELGDAVRQGLTQDLSRETWTFRHDRREPALPVRVGGAFRPGEGVGGAGVVWGGQTWRLLERDLRLGSALAEAGQRPGPDLWASDWGVAYADLAPHYETFERVAGVSGLAGANPFEAPRSGPYPLPPMPETPLTALFTGAAAGLGLHPFPQPGGTLPERYTNPYGIARESCTLCGFCAQHACPAGAKADPSVAVLPAAPDRLRLLTEATVTRVEAGGGRARGVVYRDAAGVERRVEARAVVLAAYTLGNVRLLLLSGLGRPYDPATGAGTLGRAYTFPALVNGVGFFPDRTFERYAGSTSTGACVDDFSAEHFDHGDLGFTGGGLIQCPAAGAPPIGSLHVPPGTPSWGAAWKREAARWYDRVALVHAQGEVLAAPGRHLDLDPAYRDAAGDPLLRITFDWSEDERRRSRFLAARIEELLRAMGAAQVAIDLPAERPYDVATYQCTHNAGGAIMGGDPATSAVDPECRLWEVPNLYVVGASAFPQTPGRNPTGTVGALAYRAAATIARDLGRTSPARGEVPRTALPRRRGDFTPGAPPGPP